MFAIAPDDIKIAEAVIAGAAPISTPVATYGLVPGSSTQRIRILPGAVTFSAWGTVDL